MVETGNLKAQVGKEVIYRDSSVLGLGYVKPVSGSVTDVDSSVRRRNMQNGARDRSPMDPMANNSGSKYRTTASSGYGAT